MAQYPGITLTNAGINMIAESQASGTALIFTNLKMGDGKLSDGEDIKALTAVKNPLLTALVSSYINQGDGQIKARYVVSNSGLSTGFFAREIGIYAKLGTNGAEQLYAYTNAGNLSDYIPDKSTPVDEQIIDIYIVVSNASGVTVVTDSSIVYITKKDLDEHKVAADSHAPAFAAHNSDTASHADIRAALKKAGGVPIGTITARLSKKPEAGELALDTGALISRATYPDLWAWVQANAPLISEADWQAQAAAQTSVGAYSTGDGSTTFRLPRILDYMRGGLTADVGKWQEDAIRNIKGHVGGVSISNTYSGAPDSQGASTPPFKSTGTMTFFDRNGNGSGGIQSFTDFDASLVVPTADENRPKTIKVLYCVKAFDAETNPGLVDLTALANEMANKVNTIDLGFSMLYPNGGSSASPANVAVNSRYVCNNPFPGYHVLCIAEILYGGKWCIAGWEFSGTTSGYGVMASHLLPEDKIIVKTGNTGISSVGGVGGTGNDMILGDVTTVQPCRVKVWKVGGKIG